YCSPAGQVLVGSFYSPGTNEYSIPVGGEIDQIFAKYGFTRGIYWRSGYKDYMHYSFFGT
ncbi:MAG: M15 family peptidase, partial [Oscillospiraceae bacterium]|nr:M15 family peptidase [Oscillospiraceae bacterium]